MNMRLNIFDSSCQTITIPVNVVGVMGAGLAKQFAQKYPDGDKTYKTFCHDKSLVVGRVAFYDAGNKKFCFFPTKGHWRNNSRLEDILAGLRDLYRVYGAAGVHSIAFPRLGCGLGGLDWKSVSEYIDKFAAHVDIPVEVYDDVNGKILTPGKNKITPPDNEKFLF